MGKQRPEISDDKHVVLQFRPRRPTGPAASRPTENSAEAASPDQPPRRPPVSDQPDDFRHRMLANAAAFAFTIALTAVGLWLAMSIAGLRLAGTAP
jgi:hypothetical protein